MIIQKRLKSAAKPIRYEGGYLRTALSGGSMNIENPVLNQAKTSGKFSPLQIPEAVSPSSVDGFGSDRI